jgi:hypothetical protein
MKRILSILMVIFSTLISISGQSPVPEPSAIIDTLFSRLVTSSSDEDRLRINDSIILFIDSYTGSDTIMDHTFEGLKYLGQISSRNSYLKILTWNLLLKESASRYYCYLINRPGKKNVVYRLTGTYSEKPVRTDTTYSEKDWYGTLYYDLRLFSKDSQDYWILLGIDYGNPSVTRKIIDAVSFTDGGIIFGKKIFESDDETKYREVLEYSSEAVASLKFASDTSIVFDHLVPMFPALKGQKEFYGPDFSFDAYNLENGVWRFETDVDVRNEK